MKPFLVLALVALVNARPEAGYSYNAPAPAPQPSSSYGLPSGSGFGGGLGLSSGGLGGGFGGHSSGFNGGQSHGLGSGSFGGQSFGGQSFGGQSFGGGQTQAFSSGSSSSSSFGGGSSFGGFQSQAPLVSKHVYVHVAPEEPEFQRPARINTPSQARKHYKIVFIKAPTAPTPTAAQVQLPQQDEEKTIIYVLSKKQEDQPELQINQAAPTTPTKPEVYFIKYNTKKDQGGFGSGVNLGLAAGAGNLGGLGNSLSASGSGAAGPSSSYGAPAAHSAPAPSSGYGVPSGNGGY